MTDIKALFKKKKKGKKALSFKKKLEAAGVLPGSGSATTAGENGSEQNPESSLLASLMSTSKGKEKEVKEVAETSFPTLGGAKVQKKSTVFVWGLHENERLMEFFGSEGLEDSKAKFAKAFQQAREEAETPRGKAEEAAEKAAEKAAKEAPLDEIVVWPPLNADPGVLRQHLLDELRRDTESSVFYVEQPSAVKDTLCPYDENFSVDRKPQLYADAFKKEWTGFYRLKPGFEKLQLPLACIDPLCRFPGFMNTTLYYAALRELSTCTGNVFEMLVGHYCNVNKSVVCQNKECAEAGTIQWSGGASTSWQDFFCSACGAYYEMKSKTSNGTQRALVRHETRGGSYSRFVEQRQQGRMHFMILLNRDPTLADESTNNHSVYCSRIKYGVPTFDEKTIAQFKEDRTMRLKTHVFFEEPQLWFSLPVPVDFPADGEWFQWEILEGLFGEKVKKIQRFVRRKLQFRRSRLTDVSAEIESVSGGLVLNQQNAAEGSRQSVDASVEIESMLGGLALDQQNAAKHTTRLTVDLGGVECPHFRRNMCTRGESCVYYHAGRRPTEADKECKFFHEHRCTNGQACDRRHDGRDPRDEDKPDCNYFQAHGHCQHGAECKYRHGGEAPRDEDKRDCKCFSDHGNCRYGAGCRYNHNGRAPRDEDHLVCTFFRDRGYCGFGTECKYRHRER